MNIEEKSNNYAVNNYFHMESSDGDYYDTYDDIKEAFIDGATWMMEKTSEWLAKYHNDISIEDFKKAMEE